MDYPEMVSCRMTSDDLDRLTASAQHAGMARSEYLRTIIRIPASASGKGAVYVIDNRTMAKMLSELIRWGRHYNQAVRALNTIALFIRRGSPPEYRAFSDMLSDAEEKLAEVERGRQVIEYVLTDIAGSTSVRGD